MGFKIDRYYGQNPSDNILNEVLAFNTGTWTTIGSGTATLDADNVFLGESSLKLENTTPGVDLTASNANQDSIVKVTDDYQFSFFCKKNIPQEAREFEIVIFKTNSGGSSVLDTQSFTIGNTDADLDDDDVWVRFQSTNDYALEKGDIITFQIKLTISTTNELTTFLYFDGFMLNQKGRNNPIVPNYQLPYDLINRLSSIPTPPAADGNYQLTVVSGSHSWTLI